MEKVIKLTNAKKIYNCNNQCITALNNINIEFERGKMYLIYGHSGSGKSTLVHILGLLDSLDEGNLEILDKNIKSLNDKELSKIRMKNIGFVFQSCFLNKEMTALDNVLMPMYINSKILKNHRNERAKELLELVGLSKRIEHYPSELSGGEQQRVAIARSLANNPLIIIADEPTGNLDRKNEKNIIDIFVELKNMGKCVIIVTHNEELKKYADKIYEMENGVLREVKKV